VTPHNKDPGFIRKSHDRNREPKLSKSNSAIPEEGQQMPRVDNGTAQCSSLQKLLSLKERETRLSQAERTETVPEGAQTLAFVIKDTKSSVLNTLSEPKEAMGQRPRGTEEEDVRRNEFSEETELE
jgi:hypothetical protein